LDYRFTEDLNAAFSGIGKLLLWEKDEGNIGRIIAKVRVTDLENIPKSIRFTDGDRPDSESWTLLRFSKKICLVGAHQMRTHCLMMVLTHILYLKMLFRI
jgi:hypothetical protein